MLLAASTQRTIGLVILAIVFIGGIAYLFFNIRSAKAEVGSEIELAPNRSPALLDEDLEGRRLDIALFANLVMLTIIAIALPFYWLGEPGREDGRNNDTARIFRNRGESIYTSGAQCVNCHGAAGAGGAVTTAITDEDGGFVAQVVWKAPALNTVLSRFSEDEVLHTLNFGRNGVMPAWGAPGGGALTTQQLEEVVFYLRDIQLDAVTIAAEVEGGVLDNVEDWLINGVDANDAFANDADYLTEIRDANDVLLAAMLAVEEPDIKCADFPPVPKEDNAAQEEARATFELDATDDDLADLQLCDDVNAATDLAKEAAEAGADELDADALDWIAKAQGVAAVAREMALADNPDLVEDDLRWAALELLSEPGAVPNQETYLRYGEFLFTNPAAAGTYSCARCHTYGFSFDGADRFTVRANGTTEPVVAGGYDQGKGAFGANLTGGSTLTQFGTARSHAQFIETGQTIGSPYGRTGSGDVGQMPGWGPRTESDTVGPGIDNSLETDYPGLLSAEQIDAIVAFERNL